MSESLVAKSIRNEALVCSIHALQSRIQADKNSFVAVEDVQVAVDELEALLSKLRWTVSNVRDLPDLVFWEQKFSPDTPAGMVVSWRKSQIALRHVQPLIYQISSLDQQMSVSRIRARRKRYLQTEYKSQMEIFIPLLTFIKDLKELLVLRSKFASESTAHAAVDKHIKVVAHDEAKLLAVRINSLQLDIDRAVKNSANHDKAKTQCKICSDRLRFCVSCLNDLHQLCLLSNMLPVGKSAKKHVRDRINQVFANEIAKFSHDPTLLLSLEQHLPPDLRYNLVPSVSHFVSQVKCPNELALLQVRVKQESPLFPVFSDRLRLLLSQQKARESLPKEQMA